MIRAVRCNKASYRETHFGPGLNAVVADRTRTSDKKDSRNGLGKTTLLHILHFCLGASAGRDNPLMVDALQGWRFYLDVTIGGSDFTLSRSISSPKRIEIDGDISSWPGLPRQTRFVTSLTPPELHNALGQMMFGLEQAPAEVSFRPTFRSLISYFARRGLDAYSSPFEHFRKQTEWEKQVDNAFLLGLAWEHASEWQKLKEKESGLRNLKRAAETGVVQDVMGSLGELETARIRLEGQTRREEAQLKAFKVHPQYQDVEKEVNQLTEEIHDLSNQNLVDADLLKAYRQSVVEEAPPDRTSLAKLYEEAGVVFPELVHKRLEDVEDFHFRLIRNRRDFLAIEIDRLEREIPNRRKAVEEKDKRRSALMKILNEHGALEEYTRLQTRHQDHISDLRDIEKRLKNMKAFEDGQSRLKIEREQLQRQARLDYLERHDIRARAIELFNEHSQALYNAPGNLVVDVTPRKGFRFQVDIERASSQGISQMKVLCYDLTLAQLWAGQPLSPGFLVHDSTVFADVDERQIALALERASTVANASGFQYICMLNTDNIPYREFSPDFDFNSKIRQRLTDATPDGGLLGIRF